MEKGNVNVLLSVLTGQYCRKLNLGSQAPHFFPGRTENSESGFLAFHSELKLKGLNIRVRTRRDDWGWTKLTRDWSLRFLMSPARP